MSETTASQAFPYLAYTKINVEEQVEAESSGTDGRIHVLSRSWVATFAGHSFSKSGALADRVGPRVELVRYGTTADEAIATLTEALEQQGWKFV